MTKSSQFLKQAIVLIFLMLIGMLLAFAATASVLSVSRHIAFQEALILMTDEGGTATLRLLQASQSLFVFILPAVLSSVIRRDKLKDALCLRKTQHKPEVDVVMAILSIFFLMPLVSVLASWNEAIQLPSWLSGVERWMRESSESAEAAVDTLMGDGSFKDFLISIFIIAFMAAVSEECLFRGCLLNLIRQALPGRKPRKDFILAIWITAAIFSAFHLQFDGFFPRLLLGAWLGYLLMWTRSIWIPVLAHFTNNMLALLGLYAVKWGWVEESYEDNLFSLSGMSTYEFVALGLSTLFVVLIIIYFRSNTHSENKA